MFKMNNSHVSWCFLQEKGKWTSVLQSLLLQFTFLL